jgi:hypothetical protein
MKISMNDIIKEEVQKFAEEKPRVATTNNDFRFVQPVPKVFFYNYSSFSTDYDVDVKESNIVVTWQVSFWVNSSGIQKFIIEGQKVEGPYNIELYDQHSYELKQQTQKNIQDDQWKFIVEDDVMLTLDRPLKVKDLEFDFKNKTCKLSFM